MLFALLLRADRRLEKPMVMGCHERSVASFGLTLSIPYELMMLFSRFWLVALLLLSYGCSPEPPQSAHLQRPITNGEPTEGDFGVVGLMQDGFVFCSGTLIAPRVVLTAAHCLEDDTEGLEVLFGTGRPGDPPHLRRALDISIHPAYQASTLQNDLALILLSDNAPDDAMAWPILATPLSQDDVGGPLRIVGYGLSSPYSGDTGDKREGFTTLTGYTATTFEFGPDPSQTCLGDSGGPVFIEQYGVEYILGVASAGDAACEEQAINTRVDAHYESFILPFLLQTSEGGAQTGESCYFEGNCADGSCEGLDVATVGYCTRTCQMSLDNCPAGLECVDSGSRGPLCLAPPEPVRGGCTAGATQRQNVFAALLVLLALAMRRRKA
jgi:V8-like Glu-specific endopeptidase